MTPQEKREATYIKKYGSREAYLDELKKRAANGGRKGKRMLTTEEASAMAKSKRIEVKG